MRYVEWAVLLVIAGLGIAVANLVGFKVGFFESLPGIAVLLVISLFRSNLYESHSFKTSGRSILLDHRTLGCLPNLSDSRIRHRICREN